MKTNVHMRYGIITAIGLIAYFLIVKLFDLHENTTLRLFNGVILAFGIYLSIKRKRALSGDNFTYYNGFVTGLYTGFLATIIFSVFMAIYMFHLNPEFPEKVMGGWMRDFKVGPGVLVFGLLIEGAASTVILTLTFMQKFKPSWNLKKTSSKE